VDHLVIAFDDLDWAVSTLMKMGFTQKWHRDRIGDASTAMKTTVLEWGEVSFAMMEGIDGKTCRKSPSTRVGTAEASSSTSP
jgi:hypothetical protein